MLGLQPKWFANLSEKWQARMREESLNGGRPLRAYRPIKTHRMRVIKGHIVRTKTHAEKRRQRLRRAS